MTWQTKTDNGYGIAAWFSWRILALGLGLVARPGLLEVTIGLPLVHVYVDLPFFGERGEDEA